MKRFINTLLVIAYGASVVSGIHWFLWGVRLMDGPMMPVRATAMCGGLWLMYFMIEARWNKRHPFKELP